MNKIVGATGPFARVAVQLADEGVPIKAIVRSLDTDRDEVREVLRNAVREGYIVEMPREDWPAGTPRSKRVPLHNRKNIGSIRDDSAEYLVLMRVFKTTLQQSKVLLKLIRRDECTKEVLHSAVTLDRASIDEVTDIKIIDVIICNLRKKLKPFDIVVDTIHSCGYSMPNESRQKALELISNRE